MFDGAEAGRSVEESGCRGVGRFFSGRRTRCLQGGVSWRFAGSGL